MKCILLVDDHQMARRALKLFLEHHEYICEEAEHGEAALAWLKEGHAVDLVISDNQMPVMTGLDLLKQMAAHPHFSSLPVILYSGNVTEDLRNQALEAGAYAVLTKPYKFADLVDTITRILTAR
ncbi:MAG: response regulator [Nitrospirales bacterium]